MSKFIKYNKKKDKKNAAFCVFNLEFADDNNLVLQKESRCPRLYSDSCAKEYFNLRGCVTSPPLKSFI